MITKTVEQEKKLESIMKKKSEFFLTVKQECCLDDEYYKNHETIEDDILSGDIILEWFEHRDLEYISDMIGCQQVLLDTLKTAERGDKKSLHDANKVFGELIHEARRIKRKRTEDVQKAQEVIDLMNEIIKICDEFR